MLRPDRPRRRYAIALTPLVDVVFILLLFFMLTSSFQRLQQVEVSREGTASGKVLEPSERVQLLVLDATAVLVDGVAYQRSDSALQQRFEAWRQEGRAVAVGGQQGASVQDLVSMLDQLQAAGLEQLDVFESASTP